MNHKKQIKDGKYTVNNPTAVAEMQRALELRTKKEFKLSGDMAQQFNESQEQPDVFDDQDPDGL